MTFLQNIQAILDERDPETYKTVAEKPEIYSDARAGLPVPNADIGRFTNYFIYGSGWYGNTILDYMKERHLSVRAFLNDFEEGSIRGVPIVHPGSSVISAQEKENSLVVIAFALRDDVLLDNVNEKIRENGFTQSMYFGELLYSLFRPDIIAQNQKDIIKAAALFQEEESRWIFQGYLESAVYFDCRKFAPASESTQYFDDTLPITCDFSRFVDCGAYIGDTAAELHRQMKGYIDTAVFFEPNMKIFLQLADQLRRRRVAHKQILYPCAVYDQPVVKNFLSNLEMGNALDETGNVHVQCVSLDSSIFDIAPTFIKMDIEGAEFEALCGSEDIIRTYRPDLAVCVYHRIDDLWRLALYIHGIVPEYRFYLRSYRFYGIETVLYGSCKAVKARE